MNGLPAARLSWGSSPEERDRLLVSLQDGSFDPSRLLFRLAPHEMADPSFRQWWRMYNLSAITAPEAYDMVVALGPVDIRRLLGSIRVPTLLLHRSYRRQAAQATAGSRRAWPNR
jgi:pimeloyl-ACP methyl ester carboxylesterase